MNVTTDSIRAIRPGSTTAFVCQDAPALYTAASLVSRLKKFGMPEGVADYETLKIFSETPGESIIIIRALKDGEEKILNR